MNEPSKIIVQRAGNSLPIVVNFGSYTKLMTEDTAQVLARALQQVAFGEKDKLTVFEESGHRPAGMYA